MLCMSGGGVDEDLEGMSHEQLIAEAKKLRAGIAYHLQDSSTW
jgi:hypothetical protein